MAGFISTSLAEYVFTISELRSVQKAANKLGVKYQTIYQAMAKFEKMMQIDNLFFLHEGEMRRNPNHEEIVNLCYQIYAMDQKLRMIGENKAFSDVVALYSTETLNDSFFVPHYSTWMIKNPDITLKLKEDNCFAKNIPSFNEIITAHKVRDDQEQYHYFPFHSFTQKLWASKKYIKENGPFRTLEDLDGKTVLIHKVSSEVTVLSNSDKEIIGYRGIDEGVLGNHKINVKILEAEGIRTMDSLCEQGIGIMPCASEPIQLTGQPLVNILPEFTAAKITIYMKVRKDSVKNNKEILSLLEYIYESRDLQLQSIGVSPTHPAPGIIKKKDKVG